MKKNVVTLASRPPRSIFDGAESYPSPKDGEFGQFQGKVYFTFLTCGVVQKNQLKKKPARKT